MFTFAVMTSAGQLNLRFSSREKLKLLLVKVAILWCICLFFVSSLKPEKWISRTFERLWTHKVEASSPDSTQNLKIQVTILMMIKYAILRKYGYLKQTKDLRGHWREWYVIAMGPEHIPNNLTQKINFRIFGELASMRQVGMGNYRKP